MEEKEDLFDYEKVKDAVMEVMDVLSKHFKKDDVGFAHSFCVLTDAIKSAITTQALIKCTICEEEMSEDSFLNVITKMSWMVGTRIMDIDEHERSLMLEARKEWLQEYNDLKDEK